MLQFFLGVAEAVGDSITIDQGASAGVTVGGTLQLTATVTGSAVASWSSSNASIATVSAGGLVTGVAEGSCTITAEDAGLAVSDSITVNVLVISGRLITVVTNITNITTMRK